jgi:hypothetical protein
LRTPTAPFPDELGFVSQTAVALPKSVNLSKGTPTPAALAAHHFAVDRLAQDPLDE